MTGKALQPLHLVEPEMEAVFELGDEPEEYLAKHAAFEEFCAERDAA